MKGSTFLLIPIVVLALTVLACDNDNSSIAQDMETPGADTMDCPCFTEEDIMDFPNNAKGVTCENVVWGFNLIADSTDTRQIIAQCSSGGTECDCLGPGSDNSFMDISLDEAGRCVHMIVNGLIQFGSDVVVSGGCSFVPPDN